jgi:AraC-like DNA-binding protein
LVRVGGATAIPEILRNLGADADRVIGAAGVSQSILADPESVIPFSMLAKLIQQCVDATRSPHLGLLIGERTSIHSFGYLGLLIENSRDVHAALDQLVGRFHLHDARGVPILDISHGEACLGYAAFENDEPSGFEIIDMAVAGFFNIMRRLCGSSWKPIEIRLPRPRPVDVRPFGNFFNAPIRFGAEHGVVAFAADWLSKPLEDANPLIRELAERRVREIEAENIESVEGQLRRLLRTLVLTRRCSLQTIAQYFRLPPRTLARRLECEDVRLRELVDDARYEVARHLLADTSLAMSQVAAALGYSEASAFSRAFRRWSGKSPAGWREESALRRGLTPSA